MSSGGWQWTGLYTITSGDPMTILAGTDISRTNNNLDRADYVGTSSTYTSGCPAVGQPNYSKHCLPWLNKSNYAAPAAGTYGNSGKGSVRGPTDWDADTGLLKNFTPLTSHENFNFQLRGEFFNVFNHPQWSDPNVTFANGAFGSTRQTIGTQVGNVLTTADYRIIQFALKMNF